MSADADQNPLLNPWADTTQKLWSDAAPASSRKTAPEDLWSSKAVQEERQKVVEFNTAPAHFSSQPQRANLRLEEELSEKLGEQDLTAIVDRLLSKIVPPIVERLVQERLDQLLKAQEDFVELKP
jgi:hypothetical protein